MRRLSGIKVLSDVDKGFRRQLDYSLKKFPDSKPVHAFDSCGLEPSNKPSKNSQSVYPPFF